MIDFDDVIKNIKQNNPNWQRIPDHPCRILIIREINQILIKYIYVPKIHMRQNIIF